MSPRGFSVRRGLAEPLPGVDERLVAPETRYEILDGKVVHVPPSLPPHATRHSKVSALLEAYAANGYEVASDMLTRAGERSDFAPDASVFPTKRDPVTGGRRLEELAFEVVSTERLTEAAKKARILSERGVRGVYAIDVKRERALVWSRETGGWRMLPRNGALEDRALVLPLPIEALVSAARTDDAVARALLAKKNPVLESVRARDRSEAKAEGRAEGLAEALLTVLAGRGIPVPRAAAARIRATRDPRQLEQWLVRAGKCRDADDLLRARRRAARRAGKRS